MRKYVFFASVLVALVGVDCSTDYSNYQCKSNNECGEGSEGQTSCAVDTSKCVPVQPINVTDNNNWRSPKVGQTNFSVKLEASGGHPPYSWEFAIVGQPKDKLDWLTLKEDESDNKVNAWLTHKPQSGPTKATESGDTLEIKVSVRDNTKFDPLDNNVGIWIQNVTIENCSTISACEDNDGCCPTNCHHDNDTDCAFNCGDGFVDTDETCDGNCPTSCDDGNPCTDDTIAGSASTCNVVCNHTNKIDGFDCGNNQRCKSGICTSCSGCWNGDTCVVPSCVGKNCGEDDGCGGLCSEGACTSPDTCGGGGTPNVCGCTPKTCAAAGANCGSISNGCGGTLNCGGCSQNDPYCNAPPDCQYGQCTYIYNNRFIVQMNNAIEEVCDMNNRLCWNRWFESETKTYSEASTICKNKGYGLPTLTELQSIINGTTGPTIYACAFPNTPSAVFLTGDVHQPYVYAVDFSNGKTTTVSLAGQKAYVRCVRSY